MGSEIVSVEEIDDAQMPPTMLTTTTTEEADEVDPDAVTEPKPGKGEKRQPIARETKAMVDLRNNTDTALKEWMESLSPNGGVKVRVTRTSPKVWSGMNVGGSLATYDHYIDEDWVREHHGGGNFMLEVKKPRSGGAGWVIAGTRAIAIAGDPRTDDVFRTPTAPAAAAPQQQAPAGDVIKQVLGTMERQLERAQQQGQHQGTDPAMLQALLAPLQQQIAQLGQMLRDKDAQLAQLQNRPPAELDPIKEKMFSALIDGDSARVTQLRATHESEMRQLRQSAIDNEARLRDQFDRDRAAIMSAHDREIQSLRSSWDMKIAAGDTLNTTVKTLLEGEIRRLESALNKAEAEVAVLREKKDKSILDQAKEFAAIKEAIGDAMGEGDEEKKSTIAQIIEVAGSLPAVQGIMEKLSGTGTPAPAAAPVTLQRPMPQLHTGPDGGLYRQGPSGEMILVRPAPPRRQASAQQAADGQPQEAKLPDISPATIKIAVDFLEMAYKNGQEPADVATSVRSMIPTEIITAIRELGIDGFLTKVAKLDGTSPLSSQGGRNWTRKLGKALLEG